MAVGSNVSTVGAIVGRLVGNELGSAEGDTVYVVNRQKIQKVKNKASHELTPTNYFSSCN